MIAPRAQFLHKPSGTAALSSARPERAQGIKTQKYVNMADINRSLAVKPPPAPREETVVDLIELLFFAYRDFVSDPGRDPRASGFGRAHHRVMHFVNRNPGTDGRRPAGHPEDHQAEPRPRPEGAGRFRLHRAAHRAAGPPPAAPLRHAPGQALARSLSSRRPSASMPRSPRSSQARATRWRASCFP